jgi:hypothetical protein
MPTSSITGSMFAPTSGPGDTQHYFPLTAGDQWFYVTTTNDPSVSTANGFSVVSVNGTQTIKNVSATVVSSVNPTAAGTSAAELLAWLALPFTQPLATPTSSFGTLYPPSTR